MKTLRRSSPNAVNRVPWREGTWPCSTDIDMNPREPVFEYGLSHSCIEVNIRVILKNCAWMGVVCFTLNTVLPNVERHASCRGIRRKLQHWQQCCSYAWKWVVATWQFIWGYPCIIGGGELAPILSHIRKLLSKAHGQCRTLCWCNSA